MYALSVSFNSYLYVTVKEPLAGTVTFLLVTSTLLTYALNVLSSIYDFSAT